MKKMNSKEIKEAIANARFNPKKNYSKMEKYS